MINFRALVNRPDVAALVRDMEANPVLAALGTAVIAVAAPRFLRRFFPVTRSSASRLSVSYRRALRRSGKLPRGLKFRKRQ